MNLPVSVDKHMPALSNTTPSAKTEAMAFVQENSSLESIQPRKVRSTEIASAGTLTAPQQKSWASLAFLNLQDG